MKVLPTKGFNISLLEEAQQKIISFSNPAAILQIYIHYLKPTCVHPLRKAHLWIAEFAKPTRAYSRFPIFFLISQILEGFQVI